MTNKINIIFDNSDLHIQENLNPKNIKVFFGVEDEKPQIPCKNDWEELDGDKIDLDCTCSEPWFEIDGDQVDLNLDCTDPSKVCDYTWKPLEPGESIDFNCYCPIEITDTDDFDIDCEGEKTSDLGRFTCATGESVTFNIHGLEIYTCTTGEDAIFDLELNRTLVSFDVVESSSYIPPFEFQRDREYSAEAKAGELLVTDIKYSPIFQIEAAAEIGEIVDLTLATEDALDVDSCVGECSTFELKTFPSATLEFSACSSECMTFSLNTSVLFDRDFKQGEDLVFDLTKPYNPNMELSLEEGQKAEFEISVEIALTPLNINQGEKIEWSLSTITALYPDPFEIGNQLDITFFESTNHEFDPLPYKAGEDSTFTLSTITGFVVDACTGECSDFDLAYDPYTGFPSETEVGEVLEVQLYRSRLLYPDEIKVGEMMPPFTLNTYPFASLTADTCAGECSTFALSTDVKLGMFTSQAGELWKMDKLDSLDNYIACTAECLEFDLATDTTFEAEAKDGHYMITTVKYGEPQYLSFTAISGDYMDVDVKSLRSIYLQVQVEMGERFYNDDWNNRLHTIDLDNRKCCDPLLGDLLHVEMDDAPYNHTRYDAAFSICEYMTFDLSCRRAMSFDVDAGETSKWDDSINTLMFEAKAGEYSYIPSLRITTTVNLEDGNPDPSNPVIDIDRPQIPGDLDYIPAYTGENLSIKMGATYAVGTWMNLGGENMSVDIKTDPPFKFDIWAGDRVDFSLSTNVQFPTSVIMGNQATIRFYEDPWIIATGENISCSLETKSDYYAEFVTEGCLNNDYEEIDPESGQPIPNPNNGTSVEGDMFSKFIEGRCF